VWSDRVVVLEPLLDDNLCFFQAVEDLAVEQLITQFAVEGNSRSPKGCRVR